MHIHELIRQVQSVAVPYGMRVLGAIVILAIGLWLAKVCSNLFKKAMLRAKAEPTVTTFMNNVLYITIIVFVVLAALGKLGVQTASFITVIGAAGLAIGLAFQGALSNLASGVMLVFFKPFRVGDTIKVAGVEGRVAAIQVFTTLLVTSDQQKAIIPNAKITSDVIINNRLDEEEVEKRKNQRDNVAP